MGFSKVCISDADAILGLLFEKVYIPEKVYEEVLKHLDNSKDDFEKAIRDKLIKVVVFSKLELSQRKGIESFLISYRDAMGDGEL